MQGIQQRSVALYSPLAIHIIGPRCHDRIMWNDTDTPLAYFISFRSYGTWLHGDDRGSIDRFHNRYGAPYLPQSDAWERHNRKQRKGDPFILGVRERQSVEKAIRETC